MPDVPTCHRCDRPVSTNAAQYEAFEQMHYVCFHYEFEHNPVDVDSPCAAGGCPSEVTGGRELLLTTLDALVDESKDGAPALWGNQSLPEYLEALRGWLVDSRGYYLSRKRSPPVSPAVLLADGLRAATVYE